MDGIITALVTPFTEKGTIDYSTYAALLERQIAAKVHAVCPCGTTGEATTLSREERRDLIAFTVSHAANRTKILAGTGINSTREAIDLAQDAEKAGADALLVVTPYYNKPSQEGLFQHYKAIHDAVAIPVMLYDAPGRTAISLENNTILRLSALPRITGLKDASATERTAFLRAALPTSFSILAGDDINMLINLQQGGNGCISVLANLVPETMVEIYQLWQSGLHSAASQLHERFQQLMTTLFVETNPTPTKTALSTMGLCLETLRLPLVPPSAENQEKIKDVLVKSLAHALSL
jgi:4-hydroxy-tetrahydrodipicolinate synthase